MKAQPFFLVLTLGFTKPIAHERVKGSIKLSHISSMWTSEALVSQEETNTKIQILHVNHRVYGLQTCLHSKGEKCLNLFGIQVLVW